MSARYLSIVAAALTAFTATAYNFSDFSIAVLTDSPYGPNQTQAIPKVVRTINKFPVPLHAVVHLGDYKDGKTSCDDDYVNFIKKNYFDKIKYPLLFTPGDNDWTDCHRVDNGQFNPLDRLAAIRSTFFRNPLLSTGARKRMRVDSQMLYPPHSKHVENTVWVHNGVVFGTLHTVGSNNGKDPWENLAGGDRPEVRMREVTDRIAASVAWIDVIFDRAEDVDAPGVAIFTQAGFWPGWELSQGIALDGFDEIVQRLSERTARFNRTTWLINGDQHDWVVLTPFTPGSTHPEGELYDSPNMSVYRVHGEQYDAVKFTAFTLETYQKYDAGKEDYDPDYAFDIFELKVRPGKGDDLFAYQRHKVRYSDFE